MRPPERSPLPPKREPLHWACCYFEVGETIEWIDRMTHRHHKGKITKIIRNRFGRVSYDTGGHKQVLLEDIADAMGRKATR